MVFMLKTLACILSLGVMLQAFEATLDNQAIDRAIDIGRTRFDAERVAFHRPYRVNVGRAPVDWIEIVTPFRRVALESQVHERSGGRLFGEREARAALGLMPQRVDIVVEMTFHPMNTFVGVPSYDVALAPAAAGANAAPRGDRSRAGLLQPDHLERAPRFGARVNGNALPYPYELTPRLPRGSEPVTGGVIVAQFDGGMLDARGVYDVVVTDGATELTRARVDFGVLR
jgi:hypothetical protein